MFIPILATFSVPEHAFAQASHNHRDEVPLRKYIDVSFSLQNVCIKFSASGPVTKLIKFWPNGGIFQELGTQRQVPRICSCTLTYRITPYCAYNI
jgi:hypothetical protein